MDAVHSCNMCTFFSASHDDFVKHTVRMHRSDPRFRVFCEYDNCGFTSKNWNSYKNHVSKCHREIVMQGNDIQHDIQRVNEESDQYIDDAEIIHDPDFETEMLFAHYLLKLETAQRLSGTAIDVVSDHTQFLLADTLRKQYDKFGLFLRDRGLEFNAEEIESAMLDINLDSLNSKHKRNAFYVQNCGLVEPKEIFLGTRMKLVHGRVKTNRDYGYIVPLRDTLQSLLRMPEIIHFINHPHSQVDGFRMDVCDGNMYKTHPLFSTDPRALQIILYTDDLEITNPLGTHTKKHKVQMLYFTLGNIPPQFRSKLSAIYLLGIAKTIHVKRHGITSLLRDFISTINDLSSTGIEFVVNGAPTLMKGALSMVLADTPAANSLGGFKEGVGFAAKPCRSCKISSSEVAAKHNARQLEHRSLQQHRELVDLMANPELPKYEKQRWSKELGINQRSCLMDITLFDICTDLPHDPMHVLLEGVVPMEMALLLYYCTEVKKYFSLKWLNGKLASFPYTYLEKKKNLKQFSRHITFMIWK